jgi:hypothetical protein
VRVLVVDNSYQRSGGRAFVAQSKDMAVMVEIANATNAGVSRPIQFFHMPVPKGRTDDACFAPLEKFASASRDQALSWSRAS